MATQKETGTERLPAIPEEVTAQWLESKLGHKIKSVKMTRGVFGAAGKLFFDVEYEDDATDASSRSNHICVKGVFDPVMFASQPWTVSMAQREADFYSKIAPTIKNMGFPKGLWGGTSKEQGIAVMSDLIREGCSIPPEAASYSVEKVLDGAEQIAGLHAQFWGKSEDDYPWIWNNYGPAVGFMVGQWDTVAREDRRIRLPEYLMDGTRVNKALEIYYTKRNPKFRTLLHGDTHIGNVYFTADGHTRFLDWATFHFASCFHDLVYFMTTMMTVEDRRKHEMEVLDHYLETLHKFGGPKLDRNDEELMIEYKRSFMPGVIWPVCPKDIQSEERTAVLSIRIIAAWEDHKVIDVLEAQA
ncbi:kinase-like domain-containing protein [Durotheca rogersii]|uniref:kinase-like domain-containing protein n=1 Tax=Durotheca rogersii TaxID=419775 RepID=UPI00221FB1B0|nr:kinase-like domain-containing protein [Durotheca rogersii]KAI5868219.1 kinase-like domain-containing protein [Durotheca rogersii]